MMNHRTSQAKRLKKMMIERSLPKREKLDIDAKCVNPKKIFSE